MTQFNHTLAALLSGKKTETSRFALPEPDGTTAVGCEMIQWPNGRRSVMRGKANNSGWSIRWEQGKDYAIQPGRGVKSVGRFVVDQIWRQDVRTLTPEQVKAEGFAVKGDMGSESWFKFLQVWAAMHDRQFEFRFDPQIVDYRVREGRQRDIVAWDTLKNMISARPAERYQAWRMTIRVLFETVDWDAPAVRALQIDKSSLY